MSYATIPTAVTGAVITAANWNIIRDSVSFLASPPCCRVYNSASLLITNNTLTAFTFNSERDDNDSMHSTVTNTSRITFNTAGRYNMQFCGEWAGNATGFRGIFLRVNGSASNYVGVTELPLTGSAVVCGQYVGADYRMTAGDYMEVIGWQTSGGSLNMQGGGNTYSPEVSARWIGL